MLVFVRFQDGEGTGYRLTICAQPPTVQVVAGREQLHVPLLWPSPRGNKRLELFEMAGGGGVSTSDEVRDRLDSLMPWTVKVVRENSERQVAMELQTIRVGDTAVVSAAGEIFVKTGLAVKRRSPLANVMFAAYANGAIGYLPLPEDYPRGGYEVEESYLFYRLPGPIAPEAASLVEETAVRLLNTVSGYSKVKQLKPADRLKWDGRQAAGEVCFDRDKRDKCDHRGQLCICFTGSPSTEPRTDAHGESILRWPMDFRD